MEQRSQLAAFFQSNCDRNYRREPDLDTHSRFVPPSGEKNIPVARTAKDKFNSNPYSRSDEVDPFFWREEGRNNVSDRRFSLQGARNFRGEPESNINLRMYQQSEKISNLHEYSSPRSGPRAEFPDMFLRDKIDPNAYPKICSQKESINNPVRDARENEFHSFQRFGSQGGRKSPPITALRDQYDPNYIARQYPSEGVLKDKSECHPPSRFGLDRGGSPSARYLSDQVDPNSFAKHCPPGRSSREELDSRFAPQSKRNNPPDNLRDQYDSNSFVKHFPPGKSSREELDSRFAPQSKRNNPPDNLRDQYDSNSFVKHFPPGKSSREELDSRFAPQSKRNNPPDNLRDQYDSNSFVKHFPPGRSSREELDSRFAPQSKRSNPPDNLRDQYDSNSFVKHFPPGKSSREELDSRFVPQSKRSNPPGNLKSHFDSEEYAGHYPPNKASTDKFGPQEKINNSPGNVFRGQGELTSYGRNYPVGKISRDEFDTHSLSRFGPQEQKNNISDSNFQDQFDPNSFRKNYSNKEDRNEPPGRATREEFDGHSFSRYRNEEQKDNMPGCSSAPAYGRIDINERDFIQMSAPTIQQLKRKRNHSSQCGSRDDLDTISYSERMKISKGCERDHFDPNPFPMFHHKEIDNICHYPSYKRNHPQEEFHMNRCSGPYAKEMIKGTDRIDNDRFDPDYCSNPKICLRENDRSNAVSREFRDESDIQLHPTFNYGSNERDFQVPKRFRNGPKQIPEPKGDFIYNLKGRDSSPTGGISDRGMYHIEDIPRESIRKGYVDEDREDLEDLVRPNKSRRHANRLEHHQPESRKEILVSHFNVRDYSLQRRQCEHDSRIETRPFEEGNIDSYSDERKFNQMNPHLYKNTSLRLRSNERMNRNSKHHSRETSHYEFTESVSETDSDDYIEASMLSKVKPFGIQVQKMQFASNAHVLDSSGGRQVPHRISTERGAFSSCESALHRPSSFLGKVETIILTSKESKSKLATSVQKRQSAFETRVSSGRKGRCNQDRTFVERSTDPSSKSASCIKKTIAILTTERRTVSSGKSLNQLSSRKDAVKRVQQALVKRIEINRGAKETKCILKTQQSSKGEGRRSPSTSHKVSTELRAVPSGKEAILRSSSSEEKTVALASEGKQLGKSIQKSQSTFETHVSSGRKGRCNQDRTFVERSTDPSSKSASSIKKTIDILTTERRTVPSGKSLNQLSSRKGAVKTVQQALAKRIEINRSTKETKCILKTQESSKVKEGSTSHMISTELRAVPSGEEAILRSSSSEEKTVALASEEKQPGKSIQTKLRKKACRRKKRQEMARERILLGLTIREYAMLKAKGSVPLLKPSLADQKGTGSVAKAHKDD